MAEGLYNDKAADFDQTTNLDKDPEHAEVLVKLRKRTTELRDLYGGPYRPNLILPCINTGAMVRGERTR
jgi:hypothetical protein